VTHKAFVTAWRDFGEHFLLADKDIVGPPEAWFKVCTGTRWWDDDRMPPEQPVRKPVVQYKVRKKRIQKAAAVPKLPLTRKIMIGREIMGWAESEDHSTFAKHRDREAEFHAKIEQELRDLGEGSDWWLQAA